MKSKAHKRPTFLLPLLLLLPAAPSTAQEFDLSLVGPGRLEDLPGSTVRYDVVGRLTSRIESGERGAEGWSVSVGISGGSIVGVTTDDTDVDGLADPENRFVVSQVTQGAGNEGAVSAVVLSLRVDRTLPLDGEFDIVRLTVEATVPEATEEPTMVDIAFVDGRQGLGSPVDNRVTLGGRSFTPTLGELVTIIQPLEPETRSVTFHSNTDSGGVLDGGNEALLFDAELSWLTPLEDGLWSGVRFQADGAGNEADLLSALSLYVDSNKNGKFDGGDELVEGGKRLTSNDGEVTFAFDSPRTITSNGTVRFFLVGTLATPRPLAAAILLLPLLSLGLLLRRGRMAVVHSGVARGGTALASACLVGALVACGGGGGGGGAPAESTEVRFNIGSAEDVFVEGADSGITASLEEAPQSGPTVEL